MLIGKLGTCCIITDSLHINKKGERSYPSRDGFAIGSLRESTMQKSNAYSLLTDKVQSNLDALYRCITYIGSKPDYMRFFRVPSDLLPWFDCSTYNHLYDDRLLFKIDYMLKKCRAVIEHKNIRITTHPAEFVLLDSLRPEVRKKSIENLVYHKYFMERLTSPEEGSCINVHLNGKLGHLPEIQELNDLDLVKWITFENADKGAGDHDYVLRICKEYGFRYVHDFHHHFCQTGTYITVDSVEFFDIVETWGDCIPKFHMSQSRDSSNIRAHSEYITDPKLLSIIEEFNPYVDIAIEAKAKNLAVHKICDILLENTCIPS